MEDVVFEHAACGFILRSKKETYNMMNVEYEECDNMYFVISSK